MDFPAKIMQTERSTKVENNVFASGLHADKKGFSLICYFQYK